MQAVTQAPLLAEVINNCLVYDGGLIYTLLDLSCEARWCCRTVIVTDEPSLLANQHQHKYIILNNWILISCSSWLG